MSYQILSAAAASITELKRNPMGTVKKGNGSAVAVNADRKLIHSG